MTKTLRIASDLELPLDTVTQAVGILAKRRAGKSYLARRFAEQLHAAGQQMVIVDPKGDWFGLRSAADGESPGVPIVILGGDHGDLPLAATSGSVVAKLVVEERVSALLDLSLLRKHEVATFMTAFLEDLYRLKARAEFRTPLMLFIDEADAVAPQKPQPNENRMLGAANDIVRRGGQRGIGCTLITQRSAVLSKDVLTQVQVLIALRTMSPQDLAAVKAWIDVHGTDDEKQTLISSLPSLPIGDAWFWSPGWPTDTGIFQRSHVLPIETFDSGATPKAGEVVVAPKMLAQVDLAAISKQLQEAGGGEAESDPKKLRERIRALETQLQNGHVARSTPAPLAHKVLGYAAALRAERMRYADRMSAVVLHLDRINEIMNTLVAPLVQLEMPDPILQTAEMLDQVAAAELTGPAIDPGLPETSRLQGSRNTSDRRSSGNDPEPENTRGLPKGELAVLRAVATRPDGCGASLVTLITGLRGASVESYLNRLSSKKLVQRGGGKAVCTPEGLRAAEPIPKRLTGSALIQQQIKVLPVGEGKVLACIVSAHPKKVSRSDIARDTSLSDASVESYLNRLSTRELVARGKGMAWIHSTVSQ